VIIDLHGNVLQKEHIPLSKKISRESVVQNLVDLVERIRTSNPQIGDKIKGIGISYPGLVDTDSGTGLVAPNWPELNNLPLVRILQEKLNLFVCIENDGACMTLGQARFGVGLGSKNILGIILGRGIGAGIIINGEIYHGLSSTAGEFGHLTVIPNGPTCGCGNQGCLEVVASGEAIASSAVRLIQSGRATLIQDKSDGKLDNISAKIVAEAAAEGDVLAKELMTQAANYIGIALADVINILNPELVIFAGGLSASGKYFLDSIKETARKRAYTFGVFRQPKFILGEFGENANCIGAAALVLENILDVDFQGTWDLHLSNKTVS
jgi:glucokinase-like ROK family protein